MKVQIRINTGFVSDGGKGSFWESVNLTEEQVNEFKNKRFQSQFSNGFHSKVIRSPTLEIGPFDLA